MAVCCVDGQIRRTGRNVQKTERVEESHLADGETPPGDVPAEAEKMVQKIVPPGDCGKDLPDHADVLVAADSGHRRVGFAVGVFNGIGIL